MSSGFHPTLGRGAETGLAPDSGGIGFGAAAALEPVIDSEEAARILNINPKTLQKMARNGRVPGYQTGKLGKFRISDLDAWLRSKVISK
jgi:excisionase family DNA binding protein